MHAGTEIGAVYGQVMQFDLACGGVPGAAVKGLALDRSMQLMQRYDSQMLNRSAYAARPKQVAKFGPSGRLHGDRCVRTRFHVRWSSPRKTSQGLYYCFSSKEARVDA